MNEVSCQTAALLLDAVERRGIDADALWGDLGVGAERLRSRGERIAWGTWLEMLVRTERASPVPLEEMFVSGAGARVGHPFAQIAGALLSVRDLYSFLARWGLPRSFSVVRARFEPIADHRARFTIWIDRTVPGSTAFLRFTTGVLRSLPTLQGFPPAQVQLLDLMPHRADYALELPRNLPFLARARRVVDIVRGFGGTLDELARQASELAAKNEWLEIALEAGRIGLWRWDPHARLLRISGGLVTWIGAGQTEIARDRWLERIHPGDRGRLWKQVNDALAREVPFESECRMIDADGRTRWLRLEGRIESSADGKVHAFGSAADITEQKNLDGRLRQADRLIVAGTLAAGVAHEINNPLTYVLGSIELARVRLARHPEAAAATSELLAQALDGVERIRAVVADVRSFARPDDDNRARIDPRGVCTAAIRIVGADVRHRATITTELSPETPSVFANEAKLGQVVINLLVNASQAMPERPVEGNRVIVRTHALGDSVAIEVEDNGSGIPAEVLPRLFDPFFTTKPVGVGTGLGLSVCQGIVTSLGGRIEVTSTPGTGTRFTVLLPRAPDLDVSVSSVTPADLAAGDEEPGHSGRVLVIDDEPLIREVLVRSLSSMGFEVDEAHGGRTGLEAALTGDHRAIVCDLMMPDLDGAAFHDEVMRQRPELASRIVYVTGGAVTARMAAFSERPDITVLHKPFSFDELLHVLRLGTGEPT